MLEMANMRAGAVPGPPLPNEGVTPVWRNNPTLCNNPRLPDAVLANCHHSQRWWYTANDGHLATVCQGQHPPSPMIDTLRNAMLR